MVQLLVMRLAWVEDGEMLMPPESMWTWLETLLGERIGSIRPMLAIEQERRQKASALEKSVVKRTTEMNDCILRGIGGSQDRN